MDILECLAQQKVDAYSHQERIIMDDGLLSISDEVFNCTMYQLGFDKEDAEEWLLEPVEMRHVYIKQWGVE